MFAKQNRKLVFSVAGVLLVALIALLVIAPVVWASSGARDVYRIRQFEVAENGLAFVSDEGPLIVGGDFDGLPANGADFVTQGYIYPVGTLNGSNGTNPDGSPEFPDLVMGQWTCWGFHIGEGAATVTGPAVVTTQLFNFGEEYGNHTIVTVGYENSLNDVGLTIRRAVTGGTGPFGTARGAMQQTLLGIDEDPFSVNLHYKLSRW